MNLGNTYCSKSDTGLIFVAFCFFSLVAHAADSSAPKFMGAETCSTAGCHGAADPKRFQFQYWQNADPHSKAFSTLTTARSARMAEDLKLGDAAKSVTCTACHAPFHALPETRLTASVKVQEGVSCESCHGAGGDWLRSHPRKDYSHSDRVTAGMRDLQNIYTRANSCVACHQNVSSTLLKAGHPELIFELDGQTQAQPRHWQEFQGYNHAQAWLVGQSVALRELSWQLMNEPKPADSVVQRWQALKWLVQQARLVAPSAEHLVALSEEPSRPNLEAVQRIADQLAKDVATNDWADDQTRKLLKRLGASASEFTSKSAKPLAARRAERLVLALDRLAAALPEADAKPLDEAIKKLFAGAQILEDFAPEQFGKDLSGLAKKL
jgi:hypothetical protein